MPVEPIPEGVTFTIKSMELFEAPKENKKGERLIAYFHLSMGFLEIESCRMMLDKRGYVRVDLPWIVARHEDRPLLWLGPRKPLCMKAIAVYRAMGGPYADAIHKSPKAHKEEAPAADDDQAAVA